ncbi:tRNA (guanine-N1-)-methyltransferase [Gracilaria domingensis]|nr:tRNA (guanine-N1-)-methyltransferase [Gracilaria domingensis]
MGSSASLRKKRKGSEAPRTDGTAKRKRSKAPASRIEPHVLSVLTGNDTPKADEAKLLDQQSTLKASANEEMKTEHLQNESKSRASNTGSFSNEESDSHGESAHNQLDSDEDDSQTKNQAKVATKAARQNGEQNQAASVAPKNSEADAQTGPQRRRLPDPLPPDHAKKVKVTVLLQNANLETVKQSGRAGGFVLLNCDDHRHLLQKTGRSANDARPDITHQCLLTLLDSPLNKEGRLKIYIRTAKNVLIDVHPETRIPRTMKRFSGLMAELLEKLKVRGTSGSTPLLKVIRNPIVSHLPVGTRKIVCTYNTENVVDVREHANAIADMVLPTKEGQVHTKNNADFNMAEHGEEVNVLYVVGAMAHGKVVEDWADEYICISEYPLSAANVCGRITYAYENLFGIM